MRSRKVHDPSYVIMNAKIKQVQEFYYLGSVATYDGNLDTEIAGIGIAKDPF